MPSAFFAVLRDAAKLAAAAADDLATQSVKLTSATNDIATLTGQAAVKTAGVAGDDLAVGAGQVGGVSPNRELPALWAITKGSALNKVGLSILLLSVSAFAPVLITIALCLGALYLAYEGGEGLLERFHPHSLDDEFEEELTEEQKVKGAIRTDLVLSLEILVIALASTGEAPLLHKAMVLALVSVIMTLGVYGLIGFIIRLDDIGLALAKSKSAASRSIGLKMASAAPVILKALGPIGMFAMFVVAGGILTHQVHIEYPHWTVGLIGDALTGVVVGLVLAGIHIGFHKLRGKH
jgi:uncharacterized protein